jgi:hypothetical protein
MFCPHEVSNLFQGIKCEKRLWRSAPSSGAGGQALEEAEKIKKERGDNFELVWQLGYG